MLHTHCMCSRKWVDRQYSVTFSTTGKKLKIDLQTTKEVKKAKRFKMTPGKGHSIHVIDASGANNEFNGFGQ